MNPRARLLHGHSLTSTDNHKLDGDGVRRCGLGYVVPAADGGIERMVSMLAVMTLVLDLEDCDLRVLVG